MTQPTLAQSLLRFDMPVQPLDTALVSFGGLTGYSVLVASHLAIGRQAAAVSGDYEPREALRRLLNGTGLSAKYAGRNAFTLVLSSSLADSESATIESRPTDRVELGKTSYGAVLQASITRALCQAQPDAFGRYRVVFQMWINDRGAVREVRLLESTGLKERDASLQGALHRLVMDAPPPAGLAQPVTLLLTPRADPAADCRAYLAEAN